MASMSPISNTARRRKHHKSRKGCERCKVRRVKCNEGSPCNNCKRRREECTYDISEGETHLACVDQESWCRDLFLIQHYYQSTAESLTEYPELREKLKTSFLQEAGGAKSTRPYLMHSILALSAIHLFYKDPKTTGKWSFIALRHQNNALKGLYSSLSSIAQSNCNSLFATSIILFVTSIAVQITTPLDKVATELSIVDIVRPVVIVRGTAKIRGAADQWIYVGSMEPMARAGNEGLKVLTTHVMLPLALREQMLALQHFIIKEFPEPNIQMDLVEALLGLRQIYQAFIITDDTPERTPEDLWHWPCFSCPDGYIKLLEDAHPGALVIYAHFVMLCEVFDKIWFLQGWAERVLRIIKSLLEENYRPHIEWVELQLSTSFKAFQAARSGPQGHTP